MRILGISYDMLLPMCLIDIALAFVAGKVAQSKDYSYRAYFILSLFLPVIGLAVALLLPGDNAHATNESDKAVALRKYKQLLDEGAITQKEYDKKKSELLS